MSARYTALTYPLSEFKAEIKKHLDLFDARVVDIIAAAVVANLLKADPFWLMLVGPPSSGKTEILNAMSGLEFVHHQSTWTPQTLISGRVKKGGNPSLLFRINGKILVVKDFTSILSIRHEQRTEIIAQLREVYDGSLVKSFGTGEDVKWEGKVGFIGAVTPVFDQYHSIIASMGDRFTLFRYQNGDGLKPGVMAIDLVGKETGMRAALRKAAEKFLGQFFGRGLRQVSVSQERKEMIVRCAEFAGILRTHVERDVYTKAILYEPEPEGTPRLSKQIYQLGLALAAVYDATTINQEIYDLLAKVAIDTAPTQRTRTVRALWNMLCWEGEGLHWMNTSEVADATEKPGITALRTLEDLMVLGVVKRKFRGSDPAEGYAWQLSEKIMNIISFAEIFPEPAAAGIRVLTN